MYLYWEVQYADVVLKQFSKNSIRKKSGTPLYSFLNQDKLHWGGNTTSRSNVFEFQGS